MYTSEESIRNIGAEAEIFQQSKEMKETNNPYLKTMDHSLIE